MSRVFPSQAGTHGSSLRADTLRGLLGRRLHRSLPIVVILIIGLAASFGAHIVTKEWDQRIRKQHFDHSAQEQIRAIQANLLSTAATLRSIRALFNASNLVDRDEFQAFVQSLETADMVQALEWIPRVPNAARAEYEEAARRDGFPDFEFTERASQGAMVPAGDREEYFPVYFVEPYVGNERALGFDRGSNATRLAALDHARASGREVATARITLVQESGEQYGFLIFIPIYLDGAAPETVAAREADLTGFGLGVFRMGDVVASALAGDQDSASPIEIHVFDKSAPVGSRLLYPKTSVAEDSGDLQASLRNEALLQFATRDWLIVATAAEGS